MAMSYGPTNLLLSSLPGEELARLRPLLKPMLLLPNAVLHRADEEANRVIFPCGGMISSLVVMRDGSTVAIGIVGREGAVGLASVFGSLMHPFELKSSIGGPAMWVSGVELRGMLQAMPVLRRYLQAFTHAVLAQVGQRVGCIAWHSVEARCATKLLASRDCTGSDVLPLTQETIAHLLGVRRPGLTKVAQALQRAGLITQARGRITIIDPHGLEEIACECIQIRREIYSHLPWLTVGSARVRADAAILHNIVH
jgi:CRP-like cAMP-binding protein